VTALTAFAVIVLAALPIARAQDTTRKDTLATVTRLLRVRNSVPGQFFQSSKTRRTSSRPTRRLEELTWHRPSGPVSPRLVLVA
jgi:hypothetical protein